jgi:hypothetical protein
MRVTDQGREKRAADGSPDRRALRLWSRSGRACDDGDVAPPSRGGWREEPNARSRGWTWRDVRRNCSKGTTRTVGPNRAALLAGSMHDATFGLVGHIGIGRSTDDATEGRVQHSGTQGSNRLRISLPLPARASMGGHHRISSRFWRRAVPSRGQRPLRRPVRSADQCPPRLPGRRHHGHRWGTDVRRLRVASRGTRH